MLLTAIIWALLIGPVIPLLIGWMVLKESEGNLAKVLLGLLSISYCWLMLSAVFPAVSGPNYSDQRVIICYSNIGAVGATGISLCLIQKPRALFALIGAWMALCWTYFLAISFVV
jgi:hypothetical protein